MDASAGFWDLLAHTTGVTLLDRETLKELKARIDRPTVEMDGPDEFFDDMDGDGKDDRYESMAVDLDDPTWQMMQIAQFNRRQTDGDEGNSGGSANTSSSSKTKSKSSSTPPSPSKVMSPSAKVRKARTKESMDWSPEAGDLLRLHKLNMALAKPKLWRKSYFYKHFRTMKLQALSICSIDADFARFRRLDELSLSQNSISVVRNLPPALRVFHAFHNRIERIDTASAQPANLDCLGLGRSGF